MMGQKSPCRPISLGQRADDTDLMRYVLELSDAGKNDFSVFASGTMPVVNAVLGQFDPTLLLNGIYDVRLTAEDTSGNVASVTRSYEVNGGAKIGNFTLSFNDLTIPVSGIPITITRTYDSRNRATGDFGAGWTLDIKNIELQGRVPLGLRWEQTVSGGILSTDRLESTRLHFVIVRFPDSRVDVDVFALVTNPNTQQFVSLSFTNTSFQADPTTLSTLESLDNNDNLLFSNDGRQQRHCLCRFTSLHNRLSLCRSSHSTNPKPTGNLTSASAFMSLAESLEAAALGGTTSTNVEPPLGRLRRTALWRWRTRYRVVFHRDRGSRGPDRQR